jgi:predicted metalloendopeptidase
MKVLCGSLLSLGAVLALPNALPRKAIVSHNNFSYEISPGDDFYEFVNKKWADEAEIEGTDSQISAFLVIQKVRDSLVY